MSTIHRLFLPKAIRMTKPKQEIVNLLRSISRQQATAILTRHGFVIRDEETDDELRELLRLALNSGGIPLRELYN